MTVNMTDGNVPVISAEDVKAKALAEELENLSISSGESYGVSVDEDLHSITSQELSRDDPSTESVSCDRYDSNQPDEFGLDVHSNHFSDAPQDLSPSSSWDKNEDTVKAKRGIIHDDSIIIDNQSNDTEEYDDYQLDLNTYSAYEEEDEQPMSKPRNDLINTLATIFSNKDGKEYMKWENRVQNKLYYRESYIPVPREQRETEDFFDTIVPDKKAVKQDEVIYQYLFPTNDDPKSIVLKREHVTISKNYEGQDHTEVKELILLNHCLIILRVDIDVHMSDNDHIPIVDTTPKSAKNKAGFFQKRLKKVANLYEACHPLSSIISIEDSEMEFGDVVPLPSFQLKIRSDKNQMDNYKIHCFSLDYKLSWISALRTSVTSNIGVEEDSIYASVLCNDLTAIEQKMIMLKKQREEKDLVDKVNGYSPLHLAILASKHLIANQLLRVGANPNTVAKDGTSPLSSAKALNSELMIDMLEHHNAKELILSRMAGTDDTQNRNELFAGAKPLSDHTENTHGTNGDASTEDAIKAYGRPNKHLPALMAMTSLQERGEKLSEIEMKSSQLKDAAQNYGNMAKLMREQVEKKKKKRFFFF